MTGKEISVLLTYYRLGEFQSCRPAEHGYVNENWIVETTTGTYFLKRRHPSLRHADLIRAQHALMQYLRNANFPAPSLILSRQGHTFLEVAGEVYEFHDYIPGDLCDLTRPAHFAAAARTLGWYHTAVDGFDHRGFHRSGGRYTPARLIQIIDRLESEWRSRPSQALDRMFGELRAHARDLAARFDEFGPLPELIIHGDYYADNLIFQGDEVAGVVDYDLAEWHWRAMELAEALIYFAAEHAGRLRYIVYPGVLDLSAVERFLEEYSQRARLTAGEVHALPHLIRTIWLCASLDPPLGPPLTREVAPRALPEVLTLAGWAEAHASDIVEIGLAV
ncbi:MAG: hypothetical protein D6791_01325 [Chloroflexi bacterium]|nr:MAG: hypothetical protein D6791_01325 [Chloroflexota bacterium]